MCKHENWLTGNQTVWWLINFPNLPLTLRVFILHQSSPTGDFKIIPTTIYLSEKIQVSPRLCSFSAPTLTVKRRDSLTSIWLAAAAARTSVIGCCLRHLHWGPSSGRSDRRTSSSLCFLHRSNVNICRKRRFSRRTHELERIIMRLWFYTTPTNNTNTIFICRIH